METFFNISDQTWLFLWACVLGVFLGIVYDFLRVLRIVKKHNKTAVFIEDTFYTIFFALALFIYSTENARGQLRLFILIGALLGFLLYIFTVELVVVKIIRVIVTAIYKVLSFIYKKISKPIKHILSIFAQTIKNKFVHIVLTFKKSLFNKRKSLIKRRAIMYNKHNNTQISKKRGEKFNDRNRSSKSKKKKKKIIHAKT